MKTPAQTRPYIHQWLNLVVEWDGDRPYTSIVPFFSTRASKLTLKATIGYNFDKLYNHERLISLQGGFTIPTAVQALMCFVLCQRLTMFYMPIFLVRLDERTKEIIILAGEETEISINQHGQWVFTR